MKRIYLISIILISTINSFSQTFDISGHINDFRDSTAFSWVKIELIKDGKVEFNGHSDKNGNYEIKNISPNTYDIKLSTSEYRDKLILNYNLEPCLDNINFFYPNSCETLAAICPYGHEDHIIPILYGFPSEKAFESAEKEELKLGGCIISDCNPHLYCKKHKINF